MIIIIHYYYNELSTQNFVYFHRKPFSLDITKCCLDWQVHRKRMYDFSMN